jgi:ribosomal protein S6
MPAAEAVATEERDVLSYELAFHVLPTVAEGEVEAVFANIKNLVTKLGGEVTGEEAPARFELAYEIVKYLEGRNRKFSSAYFGWVRFKLEPSKAAELTHEVEGMKELLRHLLIRLTKVEEENPFEFHPSLPARKPEIIEIGEETEIEAEADVVMDEIESLDEVVAEVGEEEEKAV